VKPVNDSSGLVSKMFSGSSDLESIFKNSKKKLDYACENCRLLKRKCSHGHPCTRCVSNKLKCQYVERKRHADGKPVEKAINQRKEVEKRVVKVTSKVFDASLSGTASRIGSVGHETEADSQETVDVTKEFRSKAEIQEILVQTIMNKASKLTSMVIWT